MARHTTHLLYTSTSLQEIDAPQPEAAGLIGSPLPSFCTRFLKTALRQTHSKVCFIKQNSIKNQLASLSALDGHTVRDPWQPADLVSDKIHLWDQSSYMLPCAVLNIS